MRSFDTAKRGKHAKRDAVDAPEEVARRQRFNTQSAPGDLDNYQVSCAIHGCLEKSPIGTQSAAADAWMYRHARALGHRHFTRISSRRVVLEPVA
ncbi:hypothetical protein GCM10009550_70890 [Actinocorallia libanotica]|uniref:DUF7848 domain-containing protein n=1 Tax=Actinocorallia libanotica TaxID=46162 RepID=A0ABN1RY51_9ACTN